MGELHSTEACFRALGYAISPAPFWRQKEGPPWNRFIVSRGASRMVVRETVMDGPGGYGMDVPAWYWSGLLGLSEGPWWAITLAGNAPLEEP